MTSVTIVIPVLNERRSLCALYERLDEAVAGLGRRVEIIFIDDGSVDGSFAVLAELAERDPRVRAVRLRVHAGKAAALRAGFERARGDIVVTMDADLQDDPAELPRLVAHLEDGFDLVSGWKRTRHDPRGKIVASRLFNGLVRRVFALPLHDVNCGYKAYRRELVDRLQPYGELHRYLPVFAQAFGAKIDELEVRHARRRYGKSKYGVTRLPKALLDLATVLMLTRYRDRPLHFFGAAALLVAVGGVLACGGGLLLGPLRVGWPPAWLPAGVAALTVVVAVQLLACGLIAELLRSDTGAALPVIAEEYVRAGRDDRLAFNE